MPMNIIEAAILGLVQGLTEFLPVSSSGHLVLAQELLGVDEPSITFEIVAHLGTLLSVLLYFWRRLFRMVLSIIPPFRAEYARERRWIGMLAIASVPAAIVGFSPLKGFFTSAYDKPALVGGLLICTGVLLFLPRFIQRQRRGEGSEEVSVRSALFMGIGQAFAILPGISRSGSTIVSGMLAGVKPSVVAEFSFLMALPAILAASVLELRDIESLRIEYWVGGAVAFVSGMFAILTVMAAVKKGKFEYFGIYCLIAGAAAIAYFGFLQPAGA